MSYLEVEVESKLVWSPSSSSSVQEKDSNPSSTEWLWFLPLLLPLVKVEAFRSVRSSSSSSDHQGGSSDEFLTNCEVDPLLSRHELFLGVLWFWLFFSFTKVSSERSSLISSVLAMGAKPSGVELLDLQPLDFKSVGELTGEQSGVDFLSAIRGQKLEWVFWTLGTHDLCVCESENWVHLAFSWSWFFGALGLLCYPLSNWE